MTTYPILTDALKEQILTIEPSIDMGVKYFPCQVTLTDGSIFDRVYICEANSYYKNWGIWPEKDKGKGYININLVTDISESPSRLPFRFANRMYQAGETGMGYFSFKIIFQDNTSINFVSGNAIDFIEYPPGKTSADIIDIKPHDSRSEKAKLFYSPNYFWCLYST